MSTFRSCFYQLDKNISTFLCTFLLFFATITLNKLQNIEVFLNGNMNDIDVQYIFMKMNKMCKCLFLFFR